MNNCQFDFFALQYDLKCLKKLKTKNPKDMIIINYLIIYLEDFLKDMEPYVPKD